MKPPSDPLATLNALPREQFVAALGGIFEHSPWVAEQAYAARPFASIAALHRAMCDAVDRAGVAAQLALVRAHPELAGKAAMHGTLTAESTREQGAAGLLACTPEQFERLQRLNRAYRDKFGFPFIIAVRGYDRAGIIDELERRLQLPRDAELRESLRQIYRIASLRLDDLVEAQASRNDFSAKTRR